MHNHDINDLPPAQSLAALKQRLGRCLDELALLLDCAAAARAQADIEGKLGELQQISRLFAQIAHKSVLARAENAAPNQRLQIQATQVISEIARICASVRDQLSAKRIPLKLPLDPDHPIEAQIRQSDALFQRIHRFVNPVAQHKDALDQGFYPDISLSQSRFQADVHAAFRLALGMRKAAPLRFLDVGCGSGMKVLSAAMIFDHCDGLEFDEGFAGSARRFLDAAAPEKTGVIDGDALKFENYDQYDAIYFYQPISDVEKLIELERRIAELARPNTILIAPYNSFIARAEALECFAIAPDVYVTQSTQTEAEALRIEAEMIGLSMERSVTPPQDAAIWQKIVDVCLRNGHNPYRRA